MQVVGQICRFVLRLQKTAKGKKLLLFFLWLKNIEITEIEEEILKSPKENSFDYFLSFDWPLQDDLKTRTSLRPFLWKKLRRNKRTKIEKWGENIFSLSVGIFSFGFLISPCIFLFNFGGFSSYVLYFIYFKQFRIWFLL